MSGIQVQKLNGDKVLNNESVKFDTTKTQIGNNIIYNSSTGTITINKIGIYYIDWWVATESTLQNFVKFSIVTQNINEVGGNTPIQKNEVTGNALIKVDIVPQTMTLVNTTGKEVYYSQKSPIKSNITILEIIASEILNLQDGNNLGALKQINSATGYNMGQDSIALGKNTYAIGNQAHAEGFETTASGESSHAEGVMTVASGVGSHAEGYGTTSGGKNSHTEGFETLAMEENSHAEGSQTKARGKRSHAEGSSTEANGDNSHAEGDRTNAFGDASHAEGLLTVALGAHSHAQGYRTQANGGRSNALGEMTIAKGDNSVAQGKQTEADGLNSFAGGLGNTTHGVTGAYIIGKYGEAKGLSATTGGASGGVGFNNGEYGFFLGNGIDENNRSLAAALLTNGSLFIDGGVNTPAADYAEMFETIDGKNIDVGYFVTFADGNKIKIANSKDDYILGVVSATPGIIGNHQSLRWSEKYITDEWGRIKYHEVDKDGYKKVEPMISPKWNNKEEYIARINREEWVAVGLLGQIRVRDNGECAVNGYCSVGDNGIAVPSNNGYRVIKRINNNQIVILFNSIGNIKNLDNSLVNNKEDINLLYKNISEMSKKIEELEKIIIDIKTNK